MLEGVACWMQNITLRITNLFRPQCAILIIKIFSSNVYVSLYFGKLVIIYSSVERLETDINMPRLLIGRNNHWPKKNHGLPEIIMMISDSNS